MRIKNTELVNSWRPGLTPQRFNKVLVVFISKDAGLRRAAEDHLARKMGNAVPAYTVFPDALLQDKDQAKAWVKQQGFDGAVILRPARAEQETTVVPGQTYAVPLSHGDMWVLGNRLRLRLRPGVRQAGPGRERGGKRLFGGR